MAEVAPSAGGGGANRSFLMIIGGLAALLFIGLLALGAIFVLPGLFGSGNLQIAAITATPTRIAIPATPSRTAQPTATLVVVALDTVAPTEAVSTSAPPDTATAIPITATPILITATPGPGSADQGNLPESGLGEDLMMLFGGGLLLLGVILITRRMRSV
ncbi:MAG TPA: hypothetical protein VFD70_12530 [Anaerolineae bacterium]|nr:hypothetical protein [Anaerolineae bacterium]